MLDCEDNVASITTAAAAAIQKPPANPDNSTLQLKMLRLVGGGGHLGITFSHLRSARLRCARVVSVAWFQTRFYTFDVHGNRRRAALHLECFWHATGLTVDPNTGDLTGTSTTAGSYFAMVTLSDPSRGHFQSSPVGLRPRARDLPLEGLCPRRHARSDDTSCDRVPASLLSARAAQRLCAYPSLRLSGQSLSHFPSGVGPATAGLRWLDRPSENTRPPLREFFSLALPTLWRIDDPDSEIYRCGTISMHVLRFFLTRPSLATRGCALARRCVRVLALPKQPSCRLSDSLPSGCLNYPNTTFPTLCRSSIAHASLKLAFKSHSAPRPPQTPAASS